MRQPGQGVTQASLRHRFLAGEVEVALLARTTLGQPDGPRRSA
jgi:hypothetical protein